MATIIASDLTVLAKLPEHHARTAIGHFTTCDIYLCGQNTANVMKKKECGLQKGKCGWASAHVADTLRFKPTRSALESTELAPAGERVGSPPPLSLPA